MSSSPSSASWFLLCRAVARCFDGCLAGGGSRRRRFSSEPQYCSRRSWSDKRLSGGDTRGRERPAIITSHIFYQECGGDSCAGSQVTSGVSGVFETSLTPLITDQRGESQQHLVERGCTRHGGAPGKPGAAAPASIMGSVENLTSVSFTAAIQLSGIFYQHQC